ncbi:MAG: hypothetical protein HC802_18670 [Caldilineaceae bacterium]|nr:hypothetical protein [Caldilineaceae bacterium]
MQPRSTTRPIKQVRLTLADVADGDTFWCCLGVHHLTPVENQARHNAFVDTLDESGARVNDPNLRIGWTWEGRSGDQNAPPARLDKPASEPGGNVPIEKGMNLELWIQGDGLPSDHVVNMHTRHDDERGPGAKSGTRFGHHSYYTSISAAARRSPVVSRRSHRRLWSRHPSHRRRLTLPPPRPPTRRAAAACWKRQPRDR